MMSWIKFLLPTIPTPRRRQWQPMTVSNLLARVRRMLRRSRLTAHASHAIERDATLPEVQSTLGHGNIATTSGYLQARPESSSGLKLDPGVFLR